MACTHNFISDHGLQHFTISFLFLLILSSTHLRFIAEGRTMTKAIGLSQAVKEEKVILSAQIGSRPPRCERRCISCGPCEPIQVPTNSQFKSGSKNSSRVSTTAYSGGGDYSNYKSMSWKCKCGKFIFNP